MVIESEGIMANTVTVVQISEEEYAALNECFEAAKEFVRVFNSGDFYRVVKNNMIVVIEKVEKARD
jgi:hypothetical protein